MNDAEKIVFEQIVPLLDGAASELGEHLDEIVFFTVARRLASRGYQWDTIELEARRHFEHQVGFENNTTH